MKAQPGTTQLVQMGNAGNVTINASEFVLLDPGSKIISRVDPYAKGNAGTINITTGNFQLNDGRLTVCNEGEGNAGNLAIEANNSILLDNQAILQGETLGGEGNINLQASDIRLQNNSNDHHQRPERNRWQYLHQH